MSPYQRNQKDKKRKNLFRQWHRRIGFTAAIFLFNLAVTGILLNHSDDFALHNRFIESDWLIDFYGIEAPHAAQCIEIKNMNASDPKKRICQLGENLYLDNSILEKNASALIGLIELGELFYLATEQSILIYTQDFELVDRFEQQNNLPSMINQIYLADLPLQNNQPAIAIISDSQQHWRLNQDSFTWSKFQVNRLPSYQPETNSQPIKIEDSSLVEIQEDYLNHQITYLKFIQDLHSGRILSLPGKLLTDLIGIVIILLSISGYLAWQRRKEKIT